jgi:hypothetical protein
VHVPLLLYALLLLRPAQLHLLLSHALPLHASQLHAPLLHAPLLQQSPRCPLSHSLLQQQSRACEDGVAVVVVPKRRPRPRRHS